MWKFLFMERVSHGVQRTSAVQNTAEYQNSINTTTAPSPLPYYNDVFQRDMYARVEFTNTIIVKVPTVVVYSSEYGVVIEKVDSPTYCLTSCLSQLHLTAKCIIVNI